ncbi:xanthine dehydrogenase family protein molybdopterin-binding subunit [Acanthopleuribacter pedis]|uniref:Xanthine dehydrogenase family protein molybdopterin-binding subunit n=1 Tax=Acanthopleuribacter pedis TaxID=442870 RepID=A0A8J7U478_9BACT|nr:molybdopterin cofactor-binding domain-containing protein [Acanthopleuribacter pedis]MBO1321198.1 xanthine dehydrogenase family protein molybdopterin-binding subunit [Acanthopleuribacter pedis]
MDRRHFLRISAAAAGGVVFSVSLQRCDRGPKPVFDDYREQVEVNAFIRLTLDNKVDIAIPKPEMGQGVRQALAMLVAEELHADWQKVTVHQASVDPRLGDQTVANSYSIIALWEPMRRAGAAARELLCKAAAKRWGVKRNMVTIENGLILRKDQAADSLEFGDIAMETLQLTVPQNPPLKDPQSFSLIGTSPSNRDHQALVTGLPSFTTDASNHHNRVAVVVRCPFIKGDLAQSVPLSQEQFPDLDKIIPLPGLPAPDRTYPGVAVVAHDTWTAMKAAKALRVSWNQGSSERTEDFDRQVASTADAKAFDIRGDAVTALNASAKVIEAEYRLPFLAQAPLEPMTCRVHFQQDRVEIHAPTQAPALAIKAVSEALEIPAENINLTVTRMGGSFGRRVNADFVLEAAQIARQIHAPVTLLWTREDDMRFGFFRPANFHRLKAAFDENGRASALQHHLYSSSIHSTYHGFGKEGAHVPETHGSVMDLPYGIPNTRWVFSQLESDVRQGFWRAVAYAYNIFAVESFIDEMAAAAGVDPLSFRQNLLTDQKPFAGKTYSDFQVEPARLKNVLELAAEKAGWGKTMPPGSGQGIAGCWYFTSNTYVAMVVEVMVGEDGSVRVPRVTAAIDCGIAVDPDNVRAQVEGSISFGLSAALYGEITLKDGQIQEGNFDDYPVMRFSDMPVVETHIVPSTDPPGGAGEPALPPVAPALCNAVFAATGKRVRRLPLVKNLTEMG